MSRPQRKCWSIGQTEADVTRVSGPFCVEATIPTPLDLDGDGEPDDGTDVDDRISFVDRMLDTLRRAPILQLGKGTLGDAQKHSAARQDARAFRRGDGRGDKPRAEGDARRRSRSSRRKEQERLAFSQRPVAIVFGPENGAVIQKLVDEAAREASAKRYAQLYVIGFAIQPNAENLIAKPRRLRRAGDLCRGDARRGHGRSVENDAGQPDLFRCRPA